MFDACCHGKEFSVDVHQEERVFQVDAKIYFVGHGVRDDRGLVAALNLRESRSLCLTSLEPAMELDSL